MAMRENVYLVISDLHASYKNKNSRVDYLAEIDYVIDRLIDIIDSYKGYRVNLIFLGDTADNSFKDQSKAIYFNNVMILLKMKVENIYFVVGNHEITYYKDNPFWSLFNTIDSNLLVNNLNKNWKPQGVIQIGQVVDRLVDGNVEFLFNHHPTPIQRPESGKVTVGLFHKDITCKAIIEDMKVNNDLDIFEANPVYLERGNVLRGYNYAFLGHVHKIYGSWTFTDDITEERTELNYLASLGRPNHTEVQDNFLERDIPGIVVSNGELKRIDNNKFNLPSRAECIKEEVIEEQQKVYEKRKELKYFKENIGIDNEPINNLRNLFGVDAGMLAVFNDYVAVSLPEYEKSLIDKLEEIEWL